jgi:hypothetical protein
MIIVLLIPLTSVWAGWDKDLQKKIKDFQSEKPKGSGHKELSEQQIVDGLKEALNVSTDNAVKSSGQKDGYFGNPAIKIPMPEQLQKVEKGLRQIGNGKIADEFVLSMNRAAEQAAPAARQIFWDAIKSMSFEDARKILQGNDTAATEYFKMKTTDQLRKAFLPAVSEATNSVGVTRNYKTLANKAKSVSFIKFEPVDIDAYVVNKALDGLFYLVGEEEKKIRKDPLARVTEILKQVFGER